MEGLPPFVLRGSNSFFWKSVSGETLITKTVFYKLPLVKPLLLVLISEVLLCVISTLKNFPWENRTEVFDCLKRSRNYFLCWKEAGTEPHFQDNEIGIPFSLCNCAVGERSWCPGGAVEAVGETKS